MRFGKYQIVWDAEHWQWLVWTPDGGTLGGYPTLIEAEWAVSEASKATV